MGPKRCFFSFLAFAFLSVVTTPSHAQMYCFQAKFGFREPFIETVTYRGYLNGFPMYEWDSDEAGMGCEYIGTLEGDQLKVVPEKQGYKFFPEFYEKTISSSRESTQDFLIYETDFSLLHFSIDSRVEDDGYYTKFYGVPYNTRSGTVGEWSTGRTGAVTAVPPEFFGVVRPLKNGLHFTPRYVSIDLASDPANEFEFFADNGITVTGRALSQASSSPIAGADIFIDGEWAGESDEDGVYWVTAPVGWSGEVYLVHEDFYFPKKDFFSLSEPINEWDMIGLPIGNANFKVTCLSGPLDPEFSFFFKTNNAAFLEIRPEGSSEWELLEGTDQDYYDFVYLSGGWSGDIRPVQSFYHFEPMMRHISHLSEDTNLYFRKVVDSQWTEVFPDVQFAMNCPEISQVSFSSRSLGTTHFLYDPQGGSSAIEVFVDFDDDYMTSPVPAGAIGCYVHPSPNAMFYMPQVFNNEMICADNGYTGTFSFPFPPGFEACDFDFVLSTVDAYPVIPFGSDVTTYGICRSGGFLEDFPVGRSCSLRSVDLNSDGVLTISDVTLFASSMNKAEGDEGFDLATDFVPSIAAPYFRTDLSDLTMFSSHYNAAKNIYRPGGDCCFIKTENNGKISVISQSRISNGNILLSFSSDLGPNSSGPAVFSKKGKVIFQSHLPAEKVWDSLVFLENEEVQPGDILLEIEGVLAGGFFELKWLESTGETIFEDSIAPDPETTQKLTISRVINESGRITVAFNAPESSLLTVSVYDVRGAKIKELYAGSVTSGGDTASWDGTDFHDQKVASGLYFVTLKQGAEMVTRKISFLK